MNIDDIEQSIQSENIDFLKILLTRLNNLINFVENDKEYLDHAALVCIYDTQIKTMISDIRNQLHRKTNDTINEE